MHDAFHLRRDYHRERLRRFRHALFQLHQHIVRFRECPDGDLPLLFGNVHLTQDFIAGHRRIVDALEEELRTSGRLGNLQVDEVYDELFDGYER
jgi:hypothetical protein